ncbi:alpha/beta hydrolase [Kovacikia minuta CCNUW1]|uniref:alpha/beta hydrolase n=1 Tax=Kovacikia minuta TaxID=2931930 RepID=UPI001CCD6042|nr:alpha/beta hydrolase [Kovacikia minuta]UBF25954.1 alpha/beta hydrolase [Kovacikia minuta CCNUW1]
MSACCLVGLGLGAIALKPKPALGADAVRVNYGPLEFSLATESLATFAESGRVKGDLAFYARFIGPQGMAELRQFLQRRFEVSPVVISQLTYSPMGERVFQKLGSVIQTDARQNGFYALRAALLLAASDPQGMTMMNIVRHYPTRSIRINANRLLELKQLLIGQQAYRDATVKAISNQAQAEIATQPSVDFSNLPRLERAGPFKVLYRNLRFNRDRQTLGGGRITRQFNVKLYLPEGQTQPAPVVVISHGLGSTPDAFAYLGRHLASYGFAAVIPQHLGSDATRREALLLGIVGSDVNPVEFIDRALDVTYMLDELARLSQSDATLAGRLNLQQVGAIGHSFGGYSVLALAGADPNIARLRQSCENLPPSLNAAPTLQCLANRLPNFNYHLRDPRIKAVFAISPITSIVLGPESLSKIQIPTMLMGGSDDFVASVVQEQIHPFIWLTTPEKYLAVAVPSGHTFADNTGEGGSKPQPGSLDYLLSGPDPRLGKEYIRELSLAFMQTYLGNRPEYRTFLSSAYAASISRDPLKLSLIKTLTPAQLEAAFGGKPPIAIVPPLTVAPVPKRQESVLQEIARTGILKAALRLDAAPFSFVGKNSQPTGFCVDQLNALTAHIQQQLKTPVRLEIAAKSNLDDRFQLVRENTVHVECGPNTVRDDVPGIAFSKPFFLTGTQFLSQKSEQIQINPLSNLNAVRIGVIEGTTTETFVRTRYPQAKITGFAGKTGRSQGVQALSNGSIDLFASDGILLLAEAQQQNLPLTNYQLLPDGPLTCDPYGMVLPANDPIWQDTVNDTINTPEFRQNWQKWFTQSSYAYIFLNLDFCTR